MNGQLVIGKQHLVGVVARQATDDEWRFSWVHVQQKKGEVVVERHGEGVEDVEQLAKAIGPRYPIALVMAGERVLHRTMQGEFVAERDLSKLLPNARAEDLVITSYASADRTEVSLVRANVLTALLDRLQQQELRVVGLHLGEAVQHALPIEARADIPQEVEVQAFAAAWQHWFAPLIHTCSAVPQVTLARKEERFRLIYERGTLALLCVLLLLLMGDVLLRQRMDDGQVVLQQAMDEQARAEAEEQTLSASIATRKELLSTAGGTHPGRTIRLLDRVAGSTPPRITLTELWYAPADGVVREGEPFKCRAGVLVIAGHANDPAVLPTWVALLNGMDGVQKATLRSLDQDPNEDAPLFRIEVEWS